MKHIYVLLHQLCVVVCLLCACSSENPGDLERIFIDNKLGAGINFKPSWYETEALERKDVYTAIFDQDSPSRPFDQFESLAVEYGNDTRPYMLLKEKSSTPHYYWIRSDSPLYEIQGNFEIEVEFSSNYNQWFDAGWIGLVMNDTGETGHYYMSFKNGYLSDYLYIHRFDAYTKKIEAVFNQEITFAPPFVHLFTIRKYGDQIYFFLDKKMVHQEQYNPTSKFKPRVGIVVPAHKQSYVKITKLHYSQLSLKSQ